MALEKIRLLATIMMLSLLVAPGWAQRRGRGSSSGAEQQGRQQQDDQRGGPRQRGRHVHGPGPHAGDWLRRHQGLSLQDQQRALQEDPAFRTLDRNRQDRLLRRLERFNSLAPEQQERILQRMETFEHLSPEQQKKARRYYYDFRQLPQDRRRVVIGAFHELRSVPAGERQQILDSQAYRDRFSDSERDILRALSEMKQPPRGDGDQDTQPEQ